jgi:hypothetical protein
VYLTDGASADIFTRGRLFPPSGQYHAAINANTAKRGGGIAAAAFGGRSDIQLRLSSHDGRNAQIIASNEASQRGGAFFLQADTSSGTAYEVIACLRDTAVVNNRAERGAAVYSQRDSDGTIWGSSSIYANIDGFNPLICPIRDPSATCHPGSECAEFTGNQSTTGAVIDIEAAGGSDAWFARTKFVGNSGSALVYASSATRGADNPRMISSLFALNVVSTSLVVNRFSGMWFINNTVAANTLGAAVVDVRDFGGTLSVRRNIIIQPASNAVNTNGQSPPVGSISTNLTTDDGLTLIDPSNFNADPQFAPGYRLQRTSPAVDRTIRGATTPLDLAGYPRPVDRPDVPNTGGTADLGAYELQIATTDAVFASGFEPQPQ